MAAKLAKTETTTIIEIDGLFYIEANGRSHLVGGPLLPEPETFDPDCPEMAYFDHYEGEEV